MKTEIRCMNNDEDHDQVKNDIEVVKYIEYKICDPDL